MLGWRVDKNMLHRRRKWSHQLPEQNTIAIEVVSEYCPLHETHGVEQAYSALWKARNALS